MVGIPFIVVGGLIWFPTVCSILLSFTNWDGIGGINTIQWIGTRNYHQIATIYPSFWPAFEHNLYWLVALAVVGTPGRIMLAYILAQQLRRTRLPHRAFFLPLLPPPAPR